MQNSRASVVVGAALAFFASFISISALAGPCPATGDARNSRARELDVLKNRTTTPGAIDSSITLEAMLAPGDDTNRFNSNKAARITGYVARIQPGGIESCNCHAKAVANRDTHIYISLDKASGGSLANCAVLEMSPRVRALAAAKGGLDWSTGALKKQLQNRTVTFEGWLFFDEEHKQNAANTAPDNKNCWRKTCWELHPITAISVAPASRIATYQSFVKAGLLP